MRVLVKKLPLKDAKGVVGLFVLLFGSLKGGFVGGRWCFNGILRWKDLFDFEMTHSNHFEM